MSGEIKFTIFLWILLIIFIVGRNYYRKQQEKKHQEKYLKGVFALRKFINIQNDNPSQKINNKNNLHFKSVDAAFEYMEKFFTNHPIEKKSLYHGKVLFINAKHDLAFVKVLCLIDNKTNYAIVTAIKSEDLKKELKKGDFVYVGIEDVRDVLPWKKSFTQSNLVKLINVNNTKGVVVKKLTLSLNIASDMFEFDE